jgi:sugar-phosphatase
MLLFNCSAVLFDLDGVLVDSTRSVERQYRRWSGENGLDPAKVLQISHGVRAVEVVRAMAPHLNAEEETRKIEQWEANDHDGVRVMPGAAELVNALPLDRWCVVTSGTRKLATTRLTWAGIPIPHVFVTADDVSKGKPDPAPYLMGASLLGFPAQRCLVIEDAPAGIKSAHAGGMKVIALSSTFPQDKLREADAIVSRLAQIQTSVTRWDEIRITVSD